MENVVIWILVIALLWLVVLAFVLKRKVARWRQQDQRRQDRIRSSFTTRRVHRLDPDDSGSDFGDGD